MSWAPESTVAAVDVGTRIVTVGLRLKPGSLRMLISRPGVDFSDRAMPLEDVFAAAVLRDLDLSADAPASSIARDLLQILRRAAHSYEPAPIGAVLARASSVGGLVDTLSTPERTTRDLAAREIGLAPKMAMRILRLHRALRLALRRDLTWNRVACEAGYADQAHLIRTLKGLHDYDAAWTWTLATNREQRASRFADVVTSNRR